MSFFSNTTSRKSRKQLASRRTKHRKCAMEPLEDRQLLAVVFADSFENGEWDSKWTEDSQYDWFDSTQRATDGSYSAEVDGRATDAVEVGDLIHHLRSQDFGPLAPVGAHGLGVGVRVVDLLDLGCE